VELALVNNPGLQASYAELGVASGDLLSAGVLPNPRLSYLRASHAGEYKIETILSFNILSLVTVPMALQAQRQRFEQAKLEAAGEGLRVAAETRKAYWRALAAQQSARYMEDVKLAAEASAELARRMAAVGNFSKLDRMREQAFYADATAQLARARQLAVAERERLTRLLGLWGEDAQFQLPERMPDLPAAPRELPNAEQLAMEQRLDIQAARSDAEALAKSLGLTRVTRFVNEFELGVARVREDPEPTKKGYEIGVPIPLFDWGGGRVARGEALYMQAANRIAEAAINGRSEVREAYHGYRTAYDVAKHYRDEVVPLRKQISEEVVLRYNGMLASVFELLVDARQQVVAVSAYIDALREYWLADSDLQMATTGRSPGAMGGGAMRTAAPSAPAGGH
jgi:outer membrane protein TolC